MTDASWNELAAARGAFCGLIARWRLTQGEVRDLLVLATTPGERLLVLPHDLDEAAEQRIRLLVRLDRALAGRGLTDGNVADWLRDAEAPGGSPPLRQLGDLALLRAMIAVAEGGRDFEGHVHVEV